MIIILALTDDMHEQRMQTHWLSSQCMLADSSRSCGAVAGTRPIREMSALKSDVIFSQGWHPSLQGEATAKPHIKPRLSGCEYN